MMMRPYMYALVLGVVSVGWGCVGQVGNGGVGKVLCESDAVGDLDLIGIYRG